VKGYENIAALGDIFSEILAVIQRLQESVKVILKTNGELEKGAGRISMVTVHRQDVASCVASGMGEVVASRQETCTL